MLAPAGHEDATCSLGLRQVQDDNKPQDTGLQDGAAIFIENNQSPESPEKSSGSNETLFFCM